MLESKGIEFVGFGHYLPKRKVTNDELQENIVYKGHSADEAILGQMNVVSRYWADENETVDFMASESINEALKYAGLSADEVDLLVVSNWSDRYYQPEIAPRIAYKVGAINAFAFDICCACCGFMNSVMICNMYMNADSRYRTAVVVTSDRFSRFVRQGSKGQLVVGDGSAAVVLQKTGDLSHGLIDYTNLSDGTKWDIAGIAPPNNWVKSKPCLVEEAIKGCVETTDYLLQKNSIDKEDIDFFIPHPGTHNVYKGYKKSLSLPEKKMIVNYHEVGNVTSTSIPLILSQNVRSGKLKHGQLLLSAGIGSGVFTSGMLYRL